MDPFQTLGLPRSFEVDLASLERTHRDLSRALHPDKHAGGGAGERRMALGQAQSVNEAWRIVRDPVRRAEALFALAGIAVGEANEPRPAQALLMDILELREGLAEAKDAGDMTRVRAMEADVAARAEAAERALAEGFRRGADAALVAKLGELRFYRRFLEEVSALEDELDHGAA